MKLKTNVYGKDFYFDLYPNVDEQKKILNIVVQQGELSCNKVLDQKMKDFKKKNPDIEITFDVLKKLKKEAEKEVFCS